MTIQDLQALGGKYENFVPPRIAAEILGCDQYSLNLQAKQAQQRGQTRIGCIRFYFAGRNLKLSKADIIAACGGN